MPKRGEPPQKHKTEINNFVNYNVCYYKLPIPLNSLSPSKVTSHTLFISRIPVMLAHSKIPTKKEFNLV